MYLTSVFMLKFFNLSMPAWKLTTAKSTVTITQHLKTTQHIGVSKMRKNYTLVSQIRLPTFTSTSGTTVKKSSCLSKSLNQKSSKHYLFTSFISLFPCCICSSSSNCYCSFQSMYALL